MIDFEAKIILAFAQGNMSIKTAAELVGCHYSTIAYHLPIIRESTGLNPRNFYDLVELVTIARDALGEDPYYRKENDYDY